MFMFRADWASTTTNRSHRRATKGLDLGLAAARAGHCRTKIMLSNVAGGKSYGCMAFRPKTKMPALDRSLASSDYGPSKREPVQFIVYQRQQFVGSFGIASLNCLEDSSKIVPFSC